MDMERKIDQLEKQQNDIAGAAKRVSIGSLTSPPHLKTRPSRIQFEEAIGHYPDPSLPVAHQLEQALNIIRENIQLLMEAKLQHQLVGKVIERVRLLLGDLFSLSRCRKPLNTWRKSTKWRVLF